MKIPTEGPFRYAGTHMIALTLYDPGGALKAPPPNFFPYAFNFGATLLYVGDFSPQK